MTTAIAPRTFAEAQAVLAKALPGYESRPQQVTLAERVEGLFASANAEAPRHLIGQAGTGCGKSLAYLIPAIQWAVDKRKRVVVSVTTKALQSQLAGKDLPFLQEHLGIDFSWTVLKGRSNYLCLATAATVEQADCPSLERIVARGLEADFSGEREDLGFTVTDAEWAKVRSDSEVCSDLKCKDNEDPSQQCFATTARRRAAGCQVVVANHALTFTDLFKAHNYLLGAYDAIVFDEAHEVEDIAGDALGGRITEGAFRGISTEIRNWAKRYTDDESTVDSAVTDVLSSSAILFAGLVKGKFRAAELDALASEFEATSDALIALREALADAGLEHTEGYSKARGRKTILQRRLNTFIDTFHSVITAGWDDLVRWVEVEFKRGHENKIIRTAPVSVASYLRDALFSQTPSVLVSATLAVKGNFNYVTSRLGIDDFDGLDVGTPFNYREQARLYVPTSLVDPTPRNRQQWESQAGEHILELVRASQGRALVLFTSKGHLDRCLAQIGARIKANHTLLVQGTDTVPNLTATFKSDTSSVLFGTKSFFTGIDVQGESLSLVIVDKLPFPVPTEPLVEARCNAIERAGGSAFGDYTIPVMSLVLQQAFGRLIRHTSDRGVAAILDPRLVTKSYGKSIVRDLPPATQVSTISEVEDFLS